MKDYKSSTSTRTETIGELYLNIKSYDTAATLLDTMVAREFDVEVEFSYTPGHPGNLSGRWEDAEEPIDPELTITAIKADASVHFAGEMGELTISRGTDLMGMFTGAQVTALEDRIYKEIQGGGEYD